MSSINNFSDLFLPYVSRLPSLNEALVDMFTFSGASQSKANDLANQIIDKSIRTVDSNYNQIKNKYPEITREDSKIIASYTCCSSDSEFNPSNLVNKYLIYENKREGLKRISKYLYILLMSLRKLKRYQPEDKKYLYRCISSKVPLTAGTYYQNESPYIRGQTKVIPSFISVNTNLRFAYNFLYNRNNHKSGTIFTYYGNVWGYDITLFNYFGEEEILLEPERQILIDEIMPEINDIIIIRGEYKESSLVLIDNLDSDNLLIKYKIKPNQSTLKIFGSDFCRNNRDKCKIIFDGKESELEREIKIPKNYNNSDYIEIQLKNISKITSLNKMFYEVDSLLDIPYISKWNTSNITDMSYMFYWCYRYRNTSLPDISKMNTSNVTNMEYLFSGCENLSSLPDISLWDTSKVITMENLFYECNSLKSLPDISRWNISNLKNMSNMFYKCRDLKSLPDISNWNTRNVRNMEKLFYKCENLISLPDISKWDINNVSNIKYIFSECRHLTNIPNISRWNIGNINSLEYIFSECEKLTIIPDISIWNTCNITNMKYMFYKCYELKSIPDISKWNTCNVRDISYLFSGCKSLKELPDISKWNTNKFTNIEGAFDGCYSLKSLPNISNWNTGNIWNMSRLFSGNKISSLPDISRWNTSQVTDMTSMFSSCSNLTYLPNISNWNTLNVKKMSYMFSGCHGITSLPDISNWNVNNVVEMEGMFYNCYSLTTIPNISKWNIHKTKIHGMFYGCKLSSTSLSYISYWDKIIFSEIKSSCSII